MRMGTDTTVVADRYELGERLGHTGASEVRAAHDRRLDRMVAIKFFDPRAWPTAEGRARFDAEARLAAAVNHPNVVHVYDVGVDDDRPFLVMECLPGSTLTDALRDGPLPVPRSCALIVEVLHGLGAAHAAGVLHRDLKPSNVLFDAEGHAKLADFGIATAQTLADLTATGTVVGTPSYLAPERVAGEPATVRSDLYSVGVMAYETLAGARPFEGESPVALAYAIHRAAPVPIRDLRPEVPQSIAASVMRAMAGSAEDRYTTCEEFARALTDDGGEPTAPSPRLTQTSVLPVARPTRQPARRKRRRAWMLGIVAAVLLVAALGVGALVLRSGSSSGPATRPAAPSTPSSTLPASLRAPFDKLQQAVKP